MNNVDEWIIIISLDVLHLGANDIISDLYKEKIW